MTITHTTYRSIAKQHNNTTKSILSLKRLNGTVNSGRSFFNSLFYYPLKAVRIHVFTVMQAPLDKMQSRFYCTIPTFLI